MNIINHNLHYHFCRFNTRMNIHVYVPNGVGFRWEEYTGSACFPLWYSMKISLYT